ncbi:hypothetical protein [Phenylobacterium sp.]|uniref:hypothetical protein n=1 Tax=Phenylobacterium sp. TaxID=1871053 RepID=UPI0035AE3EE1
MSVADGTIVPGVVNPTDWVVATGNPDFCRGLAAILGPQIELAFNPPAEAGVKPPPDQLALVYAAPSGGTSGSRATLVYVPEDGAQRAVLLENADVVLEGRSPTFARVIRIGERRHTGKALRLISDHVSVIPTVPSIS